MIEKRDIWIFKAELLTQNRKNRSLNILDIAMETLLLEARVVCFTMRLPTKTESSARPGKAKEAEGHRGARAARAPQERG